MTEEDGGRGMLDYMIFFFEDHAGLMDIDYDTVLVDARRMA